MTDDYSTTHLRVFLCIEMPVRYGESGHQKSLAGPLRLSAEHSKRTALETNVEYRTTYSFPPVVAVVYASTRTITVTRRPRWNPIAPLSGANSRPRRPVSRVSSRLRLVARDQRGNF